MGINPSEEDVAMEAVRRIVDGQLLTNIIPLPPYFRDMKLEIIVMPANEAAQRPSLTRDEVDALLGGSIAESLVGVIPDSGRTLKDYRNERLGKYDCTT